MSNGPYFQDQDGDTGIIGPGIHAGAPAGMRLVNELDNDVIEWVVSSGGDQDDADEAVEELRDRVLALMNLAYAEGKKAR